MTQTFDPAAVAAIRAADAAISPAAIEAELRAWWPAHEFGASGPSLYEATLCVAFGRHLLSRGGVQPMTVAPRPRTCSYPSAWFDGRIALKNPPLECIKDCTGQGRVDDAVRYWVEKLNFSAPPWLLRQYLKEFGAWEADELCDHDANLERLLWTWCCSLKEDPHYLMYLGI